MARLEARIEQLERWRARVEAAERARHPLQTFEVPSTPVSREVDALLKQVEGITRGGRR
jgi:hypothetical protein